MVKMIMAMDTAGIISVLFGPGGERVSGVADIGGLTANLFAGKLIDHTHPLPIGPFLPIAKK